MIKLRELYFKCGILTIEHTIWHKRKVIEELQWCYDFSPAVKLIDGGTAGFGLVTEIEGCKKLLVVDAVKAGNEPGTIYNPVRAGATPKYGFFSHPAPVT